MFGSKSDIQIHFIGIGGIGMSGIAEVLLTLGYKVSGSDIANSATTEKLKKCGAKIFLGHQKENLDDVTVVVYSSAIDETNPEIIRAKEEQIPIMKRAEMLAELMRLKYGLAIAGTHGKTTTTSFLATILHESGIDPTYIIGGVVDNLDGHAKVGNGNYLVAEADESDGSFLLLNPIMSVITNIDMDHMNHYGSEENLFSAFREFANKVPFYGKCSLNIHDEKLMKIKTEMKKPWITFGIEHDEADYEARNTTYSDEGSQFDLHYQGEPVGEFKIKLPGKHNVLNSLGAISLAHQMGIDFTQISKAISKFDGIGRRFQQLYKSDKLEIIDDYAHHPTEIATTLEAVAATRSDSKIVVIFEPHRFTRTKECWSEFFHCFNQANTLLLRPIYPASERPIEGISSDRLMQDINALHPGLCSVLTEYDELNEMLASESGKVTLVTLGAGAIGRNIRSYVEGLSK